MSILSRQILGGIANIKRFDPEGETMLSQRNPFGKNQPPANGQSVNPLFGGFTYALDTEMATAFENGAEATEKSSPTELAAAAEGEEAFSFILSNRTSYGEASNFSRLANTERTVLTNLARFVNNGAGEDTATEWTNAEMKESFTQDGGGTRMQLVRGEYDNDSGWKNDLTAGDEPNTFTAAAGSQYSLANGFFGSLNAPTSVGEPLKSDLDGDGDVDFEDFFLFADDFGKEQGTSV